MVGLIIAAIVSVVAGVISFLWVEGIHNMKNKHPNYKGGDFLDWDNHPEDKI
jgi:hypothetical protein